MTRLEKYESICSMQSVGEWTHGKYPSRSAFYKMLSKGLVVGDYNKRVSVVSLSARRNYRFIRGN